MRKTTGAWWIVAALSAGLASGCAPIQRLLPEGPVAVENLDLYSLEPAASGVTYTDAPRVDFPLLPIQVWGVHYDMDLVVVSNHPDWDMHEYSKMSLGDQTLWMVKEADQNMVQTALADVSDLNQWAPEIPVPRQTGDVEVIDKSEGNKVDVAFNYTNTKGDPVEAHFRGRIAPKSPALRNGSTMGHSRDYIAAVLDLTRNKHGGRLTLKIDDKKYRPERLLGFYRMQFVLEQTQGGFAITSLRQTPEEDGFKLQRPIPGVAWHTQSTHHWLNESHGVVRPGGPIRLHYHFADTVDQREWRGAEIYQDGRETPVLVVRLDRALPDLRRHFEGRAVSNFVIDINGQTAHGSGTLTAFWTDDGPVVEMNPEAPWWFADRPLRSTLRFNEDGSVDLTTVRTDVTSAK